MLSINLVPCLPLGRGSCDRSRPVRRVWSDLATAFSQALIALCVLGGSTAAAAAADLSGTVKDASGGAVANARILILTPQRAVVATTMSDQDGKFTVTGLADADYLVVAQHPPFVERQTAVKMSGGSPVAIDLVLDAVTT